MKLTDSEKKRISDLSYQKAMESRLRNPKRYGLMQIGVVYEELWNYYTCKKEKDPTQILYSVDRLKIRINEIRSIYRLSKDEVIDYFEKNCYDTSFLHK